MYERTRFGTTDRTLPWWARQDSNLQPDRYEREDKAQLRCFYCNSSMFERVCCVSARPFLVRNWCGKLGGSEGPNQIVCVPKTSSELMA
jgi:hypothetical protein